MPCLSTFNSFSGMVNGVYPHFKTDHKLWECPYNGPVQTLQSGKMDRNFAGKGALTIGTALLTDHDCLEVSDCLFNFYDAEERGGDRAITTKSSPAPTFAIS